jgi:hypothetical protein
VAKDGAERFWTSTTASGSDKLAAWPGELPDAQSLVCVSGAFTGARCSLRVLNWSGSLCDGAGCTTNLITARRDNGTVVSQHGDSGAPMYNKPDSQNATIRGMLIGSPDGGMTVLAELVSSVEGHLGVTVLTS